MSCQLSIKWTVWAEISLTVIKKAFTRLMSAVQKRAQILKGNIWSLKTVT